MTDLVGPAEVAERLGVKPGTVYMWRHRKVVPEQDLTISGGPVWHWETIEQWAIETGRLPDASGQVSERSTSVTVEVQPIQHSITASLPPQQDTHASPGRSLPRDPRLGALVEQAPQNATEDFHDACDAVSSDDHLNQLLSNILAMDPPSLQFVTKHIRSST